MILFNPDREDRNDAITDITIFGRIVYSHRINKDKKWKFDIIQTSERIKHQSSEDVIVAHIKTLETYKNTENTKNQQEANANHAELLYTRVLQ